MAKVYDMQCDSDGIYRAKRVIEKKMPLPNVKRSPSVNQFLYGFKTGFYYINRARDFLKNYGLDI